MIKEEIFVTKPYLPPKEEYMEYLNHIWESRHLTNNGKLLLEFVKRLGTLMGVEQCLPMANGHMALEMTIQAFDLTGEVITTPYTFASTTHAIVRNGLTPVFCDIKESDCTMDPEKIESLITDKTSAIIPVHVYGMPCDVEAIEAIAKKHNLKVIYDAAHAFGETIDGRNIAQFGDASMFSFHATKCFTSIEGGCSVVKNPEIMLRVYQLQNFGIMNEESVVFVGGNAKMNEFQAAMGLCNIDHFEENTLKRKAVVEHYVEKLEGIDGLRFFDYKSDSITFNYSYFPIFIDEKKYGMTRDALYDYLLEHKVHARKYFYPITSEFECYKNCGFRGDVSTAKRLSESVLTLPLYVDLDLEIVDEICDLLRNVNVVVK